MNDKPVSGFSFAFGKIPKSTRNILEPVIENVIILGFIMPQG